MMEVLTKRGPLSTICLQRGAYKGIVKGLFPSVGHVRCVRQSLNPVLEVFPEIPEGYEYSVCSV